MPEFYSKLTLAIWITKIFWVTSVTIWECNKTSSTSITFISNNMGFTRTFSIFITILTFWAISITFTSYCNKKILKLCTKAGSMHMRVILELSWLEMSKLTLLMLTLAPKISIAYCITSMLILDLKLALALLTLVPLIKEGTY